MSRQDQELDATLEGLDAQALRALTEALRAAWSPAELRPELNELLIASALEDPLAEPSEFERVESQRLRAALEGDGEHPGARLAKALRAAVSPSVPSPDATARLANRAIRSAAHTNVVYVAFGAAAAVAALAAGIALLLSPLGRPVGTASPAARQEATPGFALSRSTAPLFRERFRIEGTTARLDRIATERERELRSNRYAAWGIR